MKFIKYNDLFKGNIFNFKGYINIWKRGFEGGFRGGFGGSFGGGFRGGFGGGYGGGFIPTKKKKTFTFQQRDCWKIYMLINKIITECWMDFKLFKGFIEKKKENWFEGEKTVFFFSLIITKLWNIKKNILQLQKF